MNAVSDLRNPVIVTGASGFIGGECVRHLLSLGYTVRGLARDPDALASNFSGSCMRAFRCRLPDDVDETAFENTPQAIIHCAYDTRFQNPRRAIDTNVLGTKRLLTLSRKSRVKRFVFISSIQSRRDALSIYGKTKYAAEKLLDPNRDLIIRPGMVIGAGGLFHRMRDTIRRSPLVPLFYGGRQTVQTVWIGDLCRAIERAIKNRLAGIYHVAEETPIPIRQFYRGIATLDGAEPHFLPLPGGPVLILLRLMERMGIFLPISSENLLGLKQLRAVDVARDLRKLGVELRPFAESIEQLSRQKRNREL